MNTKLSGKEFIKKARKIHADTLLGLKPRRFLVKQQPS